VTDSARDTGAEAARAGLAREGAARLVSPHVLAGLAGGIGPGRVALAALMAAGDLVPAGHGLYANRLARPAVHPKELVPHLAPEAYVSLHTVLGECGVANNPSRTVYAVRAQVPEGRAPDARLGSRFGEYRLLCMDPSVLAAGTEEDRLEPGGRYRRATPERALCDWLYLSDEAGGRLLRPPPLDLDLDGLDRDRVARLSAAMGIAGPVAGWFARHAEAQADEAFSEQFAPGLGF